MKSTEKLGLKKPDLTDYVNIGDLNDNMDVLDEAVGELKEGSTVIEELGTENKTLSGAINEIKTEVDEHEAEKATQSGYGHIRLQDIPNPTKSSIGLSNVDNVKQMPISGGTFTGISKAHNNTSYTVAQLRNVILSTGNAVVGSMNDGDIWIKYK